MLSLGYIFDYITYKYLLKYLTNFYYYQRSKNWFSLTFSNFFYIISQFFYYLNTNKNVNNFNHFLSKNIKSTFIIYLFYFYNNCFIQVTTIMSIISSTIFNKNQLLLSSTVKVFTSLTSWSTFWAIDSLNWSWLPSNCCCWLPSSCCCWGVIWGGRSPSRSNMSNAVNEETRKKKNNYICT